MTPTLTNIPLFPLSGHVLPGGIMQLKIFEPRYLRMIREVCSKGEQGLIGMCMFNEQGSIEHNTHIHALATLAKVIDFEHRDDGLLGITVEGVEIGEITSIDVANDGLRSGTIERHNNWPQHSLDDDYQHLATRLCEVYKEYPELGSCPSGECLSHADWVCQRWLELLPISAQVKQELLREQSCQPALEYLKSLIRESETISDPE